MLQPYATPYSVAQSTHGQRPAAHDPLNIPDQSQNWQAHSTTFAEPQSTSQQQLPQLSACVLQALTYACSKPRFIYI